MSNKFKEMVGEELIKFLDKIKNENIIVEGKRDKKVLYSFGFKNVTTINHGLYELAEKFKNKQVIVLTDYDNEGRKIASKLYLFLQSVNCKVDNESRRKIGLMFNKLRIKTIEELKSLR